MYFYLLVNITITLFTLLCLIDHIYFQTYDVLQRPVYSHELVLHFEPFLDHVTLVFRNLKLTSVLF